MATTRARHVSVPFEIHDEEAEMHESAPLEDAMADDDEDEDQEDDLEPDGRSETSDESEQVVDDEVQEDMDKLQATFKGIKDRFRLINRIGEGTYSTRFLGSKANFVLRNILNCL